MTEPRHVPPLRLEVQFEDLTKQRHAAHFGMWLFIASEILLFAALFALYLGYRIEYSTEFAAGVKHGVLWIGTLNTSLLITSSFTIILALYAIRTGRTRLCVILLLVSIALAAAFLAFKGLEWSKHAADGALPGIYYSYRELPTHGGQLFFTLYYFMTGLHVLHLLGAVVAMAWMTLRVVRGKTTPAYHAELEGTALYWHMVDCIWIFLYPLFYLMT
jgi:cytochrome c oxidase subunit 3